MRSSSVCRPRTINNHSHRKLLASAMSSSPNFSATSPYSATMKRASKPVTEANPSTLNFDGSKERVKKMLDKVELSVSSYDTAWVAMIPSLNSPERPCFPHCVKWIMDNQLSDGSWGLSHQHRFLVKDKLSSTLACILALKLWNMGEQQINKGLEFIESNSASLTDANQHTPIGFNIIFSGMVEYAKELNLSLPLELRETGVVLLKRDLELRSGFDGNLEGRKAYLAYVSEGIRKSQNWDMIMKYQRKNGSLFNSPSTTAAAFIQLHDDRCFHYLCSLLDKSGNAVPTTYPLDDYARLCMVDTLIRLGIDRHFREEIKFVLDETYQYWLQGEEDIFLDVATCAMAFRLLRANGYDVSSDVLSRFSEDQFLNSYQGYLRDTGAALELYKASQMLYPSELHLEKQLSWTSQFLEQGILNGSNYVGRLNQYAITEVHDALKFPQHADLDRLVNRRSIEHYNVDNTRILKTSFRCSSIGNKDHLKLAVEDFNFVQSIQLEELEYLGRWVVENRLDKLKFARQKLAYCYFSAAASMPAPELSSARISWAKNGVLTTVVDDFFDVGGTEEELLNLVQLIEKWDVDENTVFCSKEVEIIFHALHSTISEIGNKAFKCQGRDVMSHVADVWLDLLKSMFQEAQWTSKKSVPTLVEYMENAYVSFALGPIVLPALYFVGPKLSEEVVSSPEFHDLFKVMSTCGRLLNDWRGFQRESNEGKLNAVSLQMIHDSGDLTKEQTVEKLKGVIEQETKKLLKMVLQEKDSMVPRPCKDMFWKMIRVLHLFYRKDDGFTSNEMIDVANAVFGEPINLDDLLV
ncbi:hypothetical protein K2173_010658 [Erythroxylum novogranatense]|uniref:ent-kaurene synthase n=1 Tax=Erythroxylum novogranatense TaxID=1862640 RepID=A0AAV8T783_9ROSI|nr:hypothetical protein K2173_010658 [Erythroxylum novogranatense]